MKKTFTRSLFIILTLLALTIGAAGSSPAQRARAASKPQTLADIPQAAKSNISKTLGQDDAKYHFQKTANGYRLGDASEALRAEFTDAGLLLQSEKSTWSLSLQGVGYGDSLQAVSRVAPSSNANRVEYNHGSLTEWYVNGPFGLEQGWTLASAPATRTDGVLTLALSLSGNARVDAGNKSLSLLNDDGTTLINYAGLTAYDATGRELPTWLEYSAGTPMFVRVDDAGAQYPLTIDPYMTPLTLATGTWAGDELGYSVAISADNSTIAVGAEGVNYKRGAVYVFTKTIAGTYPLVATLTKATANPEEYLGVSVAISADGSIIAAGAYGFETDTSYPPNLLGAVYVFVRPVGGWATTGTPTAALTNAAGQDWDFLGVSVAISADGSIIAAGALGASYNFTTRGGAVYIFLKPGGGWATTSAPTARLINSGAAGGEYMATSVAMNGSGSTVVAGAPQTKCSSGAQKCGALFVFVKPAGGWTGTLGQTAKLSNSSGSEFEYLGGSVAINSGGTVIAGGATGVASGKGAVYIFTPSIGGWINTATPNATLTVAAGVASDKLGTSVAINSTASVIVAGASNANGGKGAAYVFNKSGANWASDGMPNATLTYSSGVSGDGLGSSIAVNSDGTLVVTGAPLVSSKKGSAYLFKYTSANVAPTDLILSNSKLAENKPVGTVVGTLSTTDPDVGDGFTYSLTCATPGADDASFTTLWDSLKTAQKFDFETKNNYAICIRTTDTGGKFLDKNFTITVTDVNEETAKNGGFNLYPAGKVTPSSWMAGQFASTADIKDGKDISVKKEGTASVKITGEIGKVKTLTQAFLLSGKKGDTFIFSYYVKALFFPNANLCQAQVTFFNGTSNQGTKTLKCPIGITYDWRKVALNFTAPADYSKIIIKITYNKISGIAWFDLISLLR